MGSIQSDRLSKTPASPVASSVEDWIAQQLAPNAGVKVRLRGNILHVLCETPNLLHRAGAIARLIDGLLTKRGNRLVEGAYPQVYQLYLYSRRQGHTKPDWAAPIYLNRLERHKQQLQQQSSQSLAIAAAQLPGEAPRLADPSKGTALVLSQLSLARQGDPSAIAWYLSEVLSTLDIGVWVSIRAVPGAVPPSEHDLAEPDLVEDTDVSNAPSRPEAPRLWILCEAAYSPDPLLIAEPVTERLRQLALSQFKDAVIVIQVQGEKTPDWSLRVDLTSPEEMLREWGRWGDPDAIARLVNQSLATVGARVEAEHQDVSLHLMVSGPSPDGAVPDAAAVMAALAPVLEGLAPQGIHRAVVYGQTSPSTAPDWVRCLDLPALEHQGLADAPLTLAQRGDLPALAHLLTRLLNPDLDAWLATGGIRIRVLQRQALLHVMADAPVCPPRRQIVPAVLDFLTTLQLAEVEGIRIYGRRAGQHRPTWSYGSDFQERERLIPKAEPVFAASDTHVGELLTALDHPAEAGGAFQKDTPGDGPQGVGLLRWALLKTQLFTAQQELPRTPPRLAASDRRDALKIGLVWGVVGVLLAFQADWILGQVLTTTAAPAPEETATSQEIQAEIQSDAPVNIAEPGLTPVTDASFIERPTDRPLAPEISLVSPYASFKAEQLDQKLALYHQRLATEGAADVLVLGSSRALRGVDPAVLRAELADLGFGELSVFNFGINGATAQVVELTLRRILEADQLPRLILWADGARAFNSGRVDITYNAIATSAGYQQLSQRPRGDVPATADPEATAEAAAEPAPSLGDALRESYQTLDETLSQQLGSLSAVYGERDRLKHLIKEQVFAPLVAPLAVPLSQIYNGQNTSDLPIPKDSPVDGDGFLALDVEFNPATYYQQYARVPGRYDSDYEAFELQGNQIEAFERLLRYTQRLEIPMVFVNTPLTDEYLDDYRMDAEMAFQRLMLEFSLEEEFFVFRDLGPLWRDRYRYFSDPSHLNRYGASQVSDHLANDPMIAWPVAPAPAVSDGASAP